jgi:arabinose-5-phosphate isomerase
VVLTGIGKSGIIAKKISATLASTGTPSFFLHPTEALHGDLGMLTKKDVVIAISNSGETEELIRLIPQIRLIPAKIISIVGNPNSTLYKEADASILFYVNEEGGYLNLAPMASTTVSLALGDAIASVLMEKRKFKKEDFVRFHPAGSLGRKLMLKVKDIMHRDNLPIVRRETPLMDVIKEMITANLGAVLVRGRKGHLRGIITDGDFKRILDTHKEKIFELKAVDVMTPKPIYIYEDMLAEEALKMMQKKREITVLPVVDKNKKIIGLLRMHDVIKAKIS